MKFKKQINNLIIFDSSPRLWRDIEYQVKTLNGRIIEEFGGGKQGKKRALAYARSIKDYLNIKEVI